MKSVFKFNVFYPDNIEEYQVRFVVAESSEEAIKKLEAHFDILSKEGFKRPCYCTDPVVEIEYVI